MKSKLLLTLLFSFVALQSAFAVDLKVGTVNMKQVFEQSKPGQAARQRIEDFAKKESQPLKAKEQELKNMQANIQNNMMMSEEMKQQQMMELQQKAQFFQQDVNNMRQKVQQMEQMELDALSKKLQAVVDKLAQQKKLDIVLEATIAQGFLYLSTNPVDLTDEVIKQLN